MIERIKPNRLKAGSRIGIVNPAYWLEAERRQRAISEFEKLGYELILGASTGLIQDQYAGSPEERAADIMSMFADPSIDAIICARGGYGVNRVLPMLDYDLIRQNPKIFVGYSDVTGILSSIAQRSGLVTFHGPMLSTYGKQTLPYNLETFQHVLSGQSNVKISSVAACKARTLRAGTARGPAWGGNLVLVIDRMGTSGQIDTAGSILFLEDIGEKLYSIDRMLVHLKHSGCLDDICGLVIGEMVDIGDSKVPFGKTVDEIVLDVCSGFDFPIISNFPSGHGDYQATLPISHEIELHADEKDPFILIPHAPVA